MSDAFNLKTAATLRIGVIDVPGSIVRLRDWTASTTIIPIQSTPQALDLLRTSPEDIDAIADMAEEGATLTIIDPSFDLVGPQPTIFFPVAYAVARGNEDLLRALDTWLLSQRAEGVVDKLYGYWMLGGGAEADK